MRTLPIKERVLLEHRLDLFALRFAPARRCYHRLFDGLLAAVDGQFGSIAGNGLSVRRQRRTSHHETGSPGNKLAS